MTDMYNKLFTKILDSSIWSESVETRIVWLTFIAAMDEEGMVRFASAENVAHRARVSLDDAKKAIAVLEGPDENSSDDDNDGRRLERVAGGWIVLNAKKYRGMVTKSIIQEQTRERVRRHREKKASKSGNVTVTPVTPSNDSPIDSDTATANDSVNENELERDLELEEKNLYSILLKLQNSGEDVQAICDSLDRPKGQAAFNAHRALISGRSGIPPTEKGLTVRRRLIDALEARQRAQGQPYLSENSRKSMEAINRVTGMIKNDSRTDPDWARALEGSLSEPEV